MRLILVIILLSASAQMSLAQNTQVPEDPVTVGQVLPIVTLEARVVQVVLNDEHLDGVDWEAIVSDFHSLQLKKEDNPVWADKKYSLSIGEVSHEDYEVLLDALDTVGHMSQRDFAQTSLVWGEAATMDVTFDAKELPTFYLQVKWVNSPSGIPKLMVEPSFEVDLKEAGGPDFPQTLKAQTEVDLKDNTTLVIGGFMIEEEIKKTKKFPLLGDLPLLGLVFRKQGKLMQRTETIIFLSMHMAMPQESKEEKT